MARPKGSKNAAVSYTHLDVYKRQVPKCLSAVQTGGLLLVLSYQNKPCSESANLRRRSEISVHLSSVFRKAVIMLQ